MGATTSGPFSSNNPKLKLAVFAIAAFCLVAASRGLLSGYSYWADELHSVTASLDTWTNLYGKWLIIDVHPPLYQLILKLWVGLFGGSELATRLFSYSCAILTILIFSVEALYIRQARRVLALALVGLSPSFAFYAQETRSNSMALMLASFVTVAALRLRKTHQTARKLDERSHDIDFVRVLYYLASIVLSLAHYFGWIYVFSLAIVNFFERSVERQRWRTIVLVVLISVWPIWHLFAGGLSSKTGGNFIYGATPVLGTINAYLNGCLPPLALGSPPYTFLMAWVFLLALTLIAFGSFARIGHFLRNPDTLDGDLAGESRFLLFSITVMLAIVSVIDFHTPMSTVRNFIVLIPSTVLLASNSLVALARSSETRQFNAHRFASISIAIALSVLFFVQSYQALSRKIMPRQNFKALSAFVSESGICSQGCFAMGAYGLQSYYFPKRDDLVIKDLSPSVYSALTQRRFTSSTIDERLKEEVKMTLEDPSLPVLGFHVASRVAGNLVEARSNAVCLQPTQEVPNSAFIVLPEEMLTGREKALGLQPCKL